MPLALLSADLQLRVLLWPPSRDALRVACVCSALRDLLADGRTCRAFWRRLSPGDGGTHSGKAAWLHTVAEAYLLRKYLERAAAFDVFGRLRFWSQHQVSALLAELDHFPRRASVGAGRCRGKTLFVGQCRFNRHEIEGLARGSRTAQVQSSRIGFVWQDGGLGFDAFLEAAVHPSRGGLSLLWRTSFTSSLLIETRDCIELDISGSVAPMGRDGSVVPPIRTASGGPHAAAALASLLTSDLACIARVDFRFMGDAQTVLLEEAWRQRACSAGATAFLDGEAAEEAWDQRVVSAGATAFLDVEAAEDFQGGSGLDPLVGVPDEAIDEEELEAILDGARIQSGGLPALPWLHQL